MVDGGTLLSLTSSLDSVELVNVRFELDGGSSLVVAIPNLKWQSTETDEVRLESGMGRCRARVHSRTVNMVLVVHPNVVGFRALAKKTEQ